MSRMRTLRVEVLAAGTWECMVSSETVHEEGEALWGAVDIVAAEAARDGLRLLEVWPDPLENRTTIVYVAGYGQP